MIGLFAGATRLCLEQRVLSTYFGNIAFAYEDYGLPTAFSAAFWLRAWMSLTIIEETIEAIVRRDEEALADEDNDSEKPNIIMLQLETFFDPTTVEFLEFSEDPIPNFHRLMEEYSSGAFKVPSVGAGTANTEFECITGMNLRYFGPGEYPTRRSSRRPPVRARLMISGRQAMPPTPSTTTRPPSTAGRTYLKIWALRPIPPRNTWMCRIPRKTAGSRTRC